jgi:hypothetical protein
MFAYFASNEMCYPIVLPSLLTTVKALQKAEETEIPLSDHTRSLPAGHLKTVYPGLSSKIIHSNTCDPKQESDYLERYIPGKIVHSKTSGPTEKSLPGVINHPKTFDPKETFIPDSSCKIFNSSPSPKILKRKAFHEKEESHRDKINKEDKIRMKIVGVELSPDSSPVIRSNFAEAEDSDEDIWRSVYCSKKRNFIPVY